MINKYLMQFILLLLVTLTACSVKVPEEYVDHPCVNFCYITSAEGVDKDFVEWYGLEKELLNQVEKPVCRNYVDISDGEEAAQLLCEENSMLMPMSPACNGCDTFCDCQLKDGSYVSEIAREYLKNS